MKAANEIIKTLQYADNEATRSPYWLIIDPHQMMKPDVHHVASMITGPFFCRKDAEDWLYNVRPHAFSGRAVVYCHSGHQSPKYENFCVEIDAQSPKNDSPAGEEKEE